MTSPARPAALRVLQDWDDERPANYYRDCADRPRPCPWVGCKFHRFIDISRGGSIIFNIGRTAVPHGPNLTRRVRTLREVHGQAVTALHEDQILDALGAAAASGAPTCVLDMVEDGARYTLEEVGDFLSLTRERVRQIEQVALRKVRREHGGDELAAWERGP